MRGALRLCYAREENPAFRIWVSFLLRTHREAFARTKPVIWCSAFVPTELVHGLGGVPIHPEILASLMAYFNISDWFLERADTRISTDLCSFYRIALGMVNALKRRFRASVNLPNEPQIVGALGAALIARDSARSDPS